ncbi:substrate-binding domain-containing protein, partial [Streptomyces sp. NPDC002454]
EDSPDVAARFRGYRAACAAAGLPVPDAPDLRAPMMTRAEGARAADALVDRAAAAGEPPPQGLLFANDQMAVGALHALERRGLRVPADIAVVGFDGIALSRLVRPALTTVRQPMRRMGEVAVELLVRRLGGGNGAERMPDVPELVPGEPVSLVLPVSVARRASCGC